jgi:Cu+-exporting ATPase
VNSDPQRSALKRSFWAAILLAVVLALLTASHDYLGGHVFSGVWVARLRWIELALAALAIVWPGWALMARLRAREFFSTPAAGMMAALALFCYGLLAVLLPDLWPPAWRDADGAVAMRFELVAVAIGLALAMELLRTRRNPRA